MNGEIDTSALGSIAFIDIAAEILLHALRMSGTCIA